MIISEAASSLFQMDDWENTATDFLKSRNVPSEWNALSVIITWRNAASHLTSLNSLSMPQLRKYINEGLQLDGRLRLPQTKNDTNGTKKNSIAHCSHF